MAVQSNTYRRKKASKTKHTRWELTYGTIAAKLLRKGNVRVDNALALAKFLGAFVYLYSIPYSWIMEQSMKRKMKNSKN